MVSFIILLSSVMDSTEEHIFRYTVSVWAEMELCQGSSDYCSFLNSVERKRLSMSQIREKIKSLPYLLMLLLMCSPEQERSFRQLAECILLCDRSIIGQASMIKRHHELLNKPISDEFLSMWVLCISVISRINNIEVDSHSLPPVPQY